MKNVKNKTKQKNFKNIRKVALGTNWMFVQVLKLLNKKICNKTNKND